MTKHKVVAEKKGKMGFSNTFEDIAPSDAVRAKEIQKEYTELLNSIQSYLKYVTDSANALRKTEHQWRQITSLDEIIMDLDDISSLIVGQTAHYDFAVNETNYNSRTLHEIKLLSAHLKEISTISDKIIVEYTHLNPVQGRKFSEKNNNLLKVALDKFVSFIHKLQKVFGFPDAEKRDIVSDLQDMKTKHPCNKL